MGNSLKNEITHGLNLFLQKINSEEFPTVSKKELNLYKHDKTLPKATRR